MGKMITVLAVLVGLMLFDAPGANAAGYPPPRVLHGGPNQRFDSSVVVIRAPHHAFRIRLTLHCGGGQKENAFLPGAGFVTLERVGSSGGTDGFTFAGARRSIAWREHVQPGRWMLRLYTGCRWTLKVSRKGVRPLLLRQEVETP